ncbi:MAG: hypothetical protein QOF35_2343, partial [Actinomycetota bacterium]|nr:hypothetical protein [Actinomycetota bacterium]
SSIHPRVALEPVMTPTFESAAKSTRVWHWNP